ncbi:MAG: alpha/beta hydrolase family protein [Planctomycetota bacterium]|jgi:pimeloyl-ACP methyl ester carboxylesterase
MVAKGLKFFLTPALLCTLIPAQDLTGTWMGRLDAGAMELRLVLQIEEKEGELAGSMQSPDQSESRFPIDELSFAEGELSWAVNRIGASFRGKLSEDAQVLAGTFTQRGRRMPLSFARVEDGEAATEAPNRPQVPKRPYPYREVEVAYSHRPGEGVVESFEARAADKGSGRVSLAGTLTLPEGDGPFPAAILISGSGGQDRDESLMGHKPFLVLSDHLTRAGIAVLRYDDRGIADSVGNHSQATTADFADDAHAGLLYLQTHDEIDSAAIGLVGHSEGGVIGPLLASRTEEVAFVVMLAGTGVNGAEILRLQNRLLNRAAGAPPAVVERNARLSEVVITAVLEEEELSAARERIRVELGREYDAMGPILRAQLGSKEDFIKKSGDPMLTTWMRFFLRYEPAEALRRLSCPVLALNGDLDKQVDAGQNLPAIRAALAEGPNEDYTEQRFPGLNHLFQRAQTGAVAEYAEIEETMNQEVMELISTWILDRFGN